MNARLPTSNGYFALRVEILGADRMLDIYFDAAPSEPSVNYSGYFNVTRVVWNEVDITSALTPCDLQCIAEDVRHEIAYRAQRIKEERYG